MTNKSSSKQHGLVGNIRPKSKLRKRRNKALAKARKSVILEQRATTTAKVKTPTKKAKAAA